LPVFAQSFRTIVLDLPGFGRSAPVPIDRPYSKIAADSVRFLLDSLDIESAHLLGNSMGGSVTGHFALTYPDRADRLVMMGPGGLSVNVFAPDVSEGAKRLREFLASPSRDAMVAWVDTMVEEKAVVTDELIDERLANAMRPGVLESSRAIFTSFRDPKFSQEVPLWARASEIPHPTLITWGRDDRMLPYESGLFSFRRMPNAELHVFSRCGHWAQVERKSEFERVVTEFVTRGETDAVTSLP
jgi:4,5:9,10-diseco-3-hydroxy-5,9,17-trioxoandrosta-1(10),2-diene-4-oate hydrolase